MDYDDEHIFRFIISTFVISVDIVTSLMMPLKIQL